MYRADVDKWYYQSADGQTRAWYNEDNKPAGYTKYLKTFGNSNVAYLGGTALPGERLILVAQWSE